MSELGGGPAARASNGGSRGPVPVTSGGSALLTPRDIMRRREARNAASREAQQENDRRVADERRKSAERRAATVSSGGAPRTSQASSQYNPDGSAQPGTFDGAEHRRSRTSGEVAGTNVLGDPIGRTQEFASGSGRQRGSSISQQEQARAPQATAGSSRRSQPSQSAPRQPAPAATQPAAQPAQPAEAPAPAGNPTSSSFPHAFERWETLSSHWEGLTSYWLHKLESNTDELRESIPNASTLNRQITDLSAAGANLFHAVVELQRLRASSERKFQRWFYDTRGDMERQREAHAGLEKSLVAERRAREEAARRVGEDAVLVANSRREVLEMRRELMISKDEARRAWEELGRRNQDALDTAQSLKEGRVTLVSGVQVVPYFASRTGSASLQRPVTAGGQSGYASTGAGFQQQQQASAATPADEREYYRDISPSNTDPFTETGRHQHHQPHYQQQQHPASFQHEPAVAYAPEPSHQRTPTQPYHPTTTTGAAVSSPEAQRFYHHPQATAELPSHTREATSGPSATARAAPFTGADITDADSYVSTLSDGETEYVIDAQGRVARDAMGNPLVYSGGGEETGRRRGAQRRRRGEVVPSSGEGSEPGGEAMHHATGAEGLGPRLGQQTLLPPPAAPSVPSTAAAAMAGYLPTSRSPQAPGLYEGQGYSGEEFEDLAESEEGGYEGEELGSGVYGEEGGAYGRGPAHHHPTRLSDVLEEEEERSSRRTGGE